MNVLKALGKYKIPFLMLLFSLFSQINAQENFRHPLVVQSGDLYKYIRLDYVHVEERDQKVYNRTRRDNLSLEYRFYKYFAINASYGFSFYEKTDTEPLRRPNRPSLGLKMAYKWRNQFLLGYYIKTYGTDKTAPRREDENNHLFLLETGLSLGYKFSNLEVLSNIYIQSESNYKFKENYDQQFRRFYQLDLSFSGIIFKNIALFLESSYRIPYDHEIDKNVLFWYYYPGISFKGKYGIIGFAIQKPVLTIGHQEQGGKISYFYFF